MGTPPSRSGFRPFVPPLANPSHPCPPLGASSTHPRPIWHPPQSFGGGSSSSGMKPGLMSVATSISPSRAAMEVPWLGGASVTLGVSIVDAVGVSSAIVPAKGLSSDMVVAEDPSSKV